MERLVVQGTDMLATTRKIGRTPPPATPGGSISALEARLMTLASTPAPSRAIDAAPRALPMPRRPSRDDTSASLPRGPSSLLRSGLSAAALLLVAAFVLGLSFVLDGDGAFDPPVTTPQERRVADSPRPFKVSRIDSGRVELPNSGASLAVQVSMDPVVRTQGGWFWCVDAEPALPAAERACASGEETGMMGLLVAERVVTLDPGRSYFLQVYCQRTCEWDVLAVPNAGIAASAPR